ncbi:MAG: FliC/FljB family flagellin [Pseudomonadota bacterium]
MSVINTNITSMIGQSNLNKSQNALQTSMERLSSGLRINSAKDDAAGQAIANRMTAQITGLAQAQRNANDGISIAQTAEGSLNQVNDNLQRVRELTVQAANGTNSSEDLNSIQAEIGQRLEEIDRISRETDFNGVRVLSDEARPLTIQVGANDGQSISVNLREINAETLGLGSFDVTEAFTSAVQTVSRIGGDTIDTSGLTAPTGGSIDSVGQDENGDWFALVSGSTTPAEDGYHTITMGDDGVVTTATLATPAADPTGYEAKTTTDIVSVDTDSLVPSGGAIGGEVSRVVEDENGDYFVQVTGADDDAANGFYAAAIDADTGAVTVADWGTQATIAGAPEGANLEPLKALDDALMQVDELRSELGAVQNRFEDAITNLQTNETNLAAARSRIEDADYAVEVANMTRAQILQQAGTSVLAQANQIPQNVLSLLG